MTQAQSEYGSRDWVVVGAAFVTMALLYGLWYSYSVFLVALLKEFGWSRSVTAGAFSVFALVHAGVGPLFGPFAERVGPRRIIFAGGCVLALGLLLTAETSQPWHLYLAFGFIAAIGIGHAVLQLGQLVVQVAQPAAAGDGLVQHRAPRHLVHLLAEVAD